MNHLMINLCLLAAGFWGGIMATVQSQAAPAPVLTPPSKYYLGQTFSFIKAVDGDTLDIEDPAGTALRIRLHGIDTPERGRPHFRRAGHELQDLCKSKDIRLTHIGDGRYGRLSANVYCGGRYVNAALIESGAAIVSISYADEAILYDLQAKAQAQCRGIWAQSLTDNYPARCLSGKSPIKGRVKFVNNAACLP